MLKDFQDDFEPVYFTYMYCWNIISRLMVLIQRCTSTECVMPCCQKMNPLELTWRTLFGSSPPQPGGGPGSSNTDPSAGGSHRGHPPKTRFLQRGEKTHTHPLRRRSLSMATLQVRGSSWITRSPQQGALCLVQRLHHSVRQLWSFADHTETVPHVHHLLL